MRRCPVLLVLMLVACGQTLDRASWAPPSRRGVPVEAVAPPLEAPALDDAATPTAAPDLPGDAAGNPEPTPPPPPVLEERVTRPALPPLPPVGGRVAVVVGIDRYPNAPNLTAAVADARAVDDALRRVGFSEVRLLLDRAATRAAILRAIDWLARAGSGEPGVLFFAGHVRRMDGDPDADGEDRDEAMLAADGLLVYDGEVARALRPARRPLWLAYAACFAGGFSDAEAPGRISTYASAEHRLAYESPQLGRSFMVEYMVDRAMMGAGILGVEEMHRHASNEMQGRYRRFRPLQDDRVAGSLMLGSPPEPAPEEGGPGLGVCLPGLSC